MKAARIDGYEVDAKSGRVYVKFAYGEDGALPADSGLTLEFLSVADMNTQIGAEPSDSELVKRALARHKGRVADAVGTIEVADGTSKRG